MFKPIYDIFKYIKIFQIYLGFRMYLIYVLSMFASILEGIGILMLLPLLQSIDSNNSNIQQNDNLLNTIIYETINFLGISNSVTSILLLITIAFILKGIISFFSLGFNAYLLGQLLKELKLKLFNFYSIMSFSYFTEKNTGDLINLVNEQPTRALESFRQLTTFVSYTINTFVLIALAFLMTFSFGIMSLITGFILLFLFLKMNSYVQSLSRITAKENGVLTKWLIQSLHGFKYLISTAQINILKKNIKKSIFVLTDTQIKSGIAGAFTQSVREPLAVVFIMIIIYVQIVVFELRLEPILVSIALFYRSLNSTLAVQSSFQATFQLIGSMEMVHDEFTNQQKHSENEGTIKLNDFKKEIIFEKVNFKYKNSKSYILNSMSLKIKANSSIAFVGESGSGKTTIVDLITLTNEITGGSIYIDGFSVGEINKKSWRTQIGYVSQDGLIFDDTIANNITMWDKEKYRDKQEENKKIIEIAKQANIIDFINSLPQGFNTMVGDKGIMLSGGQKQRIIIARELYRNPKLLILDEATSALDTESELNIQKSIDSLKGKMTVIIIAHRLSTIKNADQIYLVDKGEIVQKGTYSEMKNLVNSKFSKLTKLQVL